MSDCHRLDYTELLQEDVSRRPDSPAERSREEENAEVSGTPPSSDGLAPGPRNQLLAPYSIPRTLAISPSLGGLPVTPELTVDLRRILFGKTFHVFNYEWRKSCFKFREPNSELAYALETERGGTCAIQMVVQAHIIKYLLFTGPGGSEHRTLQSLREVSERQQDRALASALTDILWLAGEERSVTVTLVTADYCITPHLDYKLDDFTERLQLFTFSKKDEGRKFIFDHIQCFKEERSHGVILFLYSLICSRTVKRLQEDLDWTTSHLLQVSLGSFTCRQVSPVSEQLVLQLDDSIRILSHFLYRTTDPNYQSEALLNLLLTGRASPNVFNGNQTRGPDNEVLVRPLHGILARSDTGLLYWSRELRDRNTLPQVGSMLKTPRFPVWVCSVNGTHSVLFSPNRSLLSDWKVEHLFQLYFYTGRPTQRTTTTLTIDTHSHHWEARAESWEGDLERRFPSVEMTIRTKWDGAAIHWNGTAPFY